MGLTFAFCDACSVLERETTVVTNSGPALLVSLSLFLAIAFGDWVRGGAVELDYKFEFSYLIEAACGTDTC